AIVCRTTATKVSKATDLFRHIRCFALCPLCEVRYARIGQIHCHHWRDRHPRGSGDVERLRPKMVGPTTRRHSDRARTFLVLFSHRYLHRCQHSLELASLALLNFPALISKVGASNAVATGLWPFDLASCLAMCERPAGPWLQQLPKTDSTNM